MKKSKKRINLLIMILIIVVIDLIFLGYNAIDKHHQNSTQNHPQTMLMGHPYETE